MVVSKSSIQANKITQLTKNFYAAEEVCRRAVGDSVN